MTPFKQTWHVERARLILENGERVEQYYDTKNDFESYDDANKYFMNLIPIKGERAYLEYSDNEQACILAVATY